MFLRKSTALARSFSGPQQSRYFLSLLDNQEGRRRARAKGSNCIRTFGARIRKPSTSAHSVVQQPAGVVPQQQQEQHPPTSYVPPQPQAAAPWKLYAASFFGVMLSFVVMQRIWPRSYNLNHVDNFGNPVDPRTGRPL